MMGEHLGFNDKVGIMDPKGKELNPMNGKEYSDRYRELAKAWEVLPFYSRAEELLDSLKKNSITFIVSPTGTGKSVLAPKMALHYFNYTGKIGMSLPKKDITSSAAKYAAACMDVEIGKDIGYKYQGSPSDMINEETNKIIYMTDGTLIMKMVRDPLLSEFNCIVIDEAHERKVQIDMLLLFLKKIAEQRSDFRIIIMSATIDSNKYQKYFGKVKSHVMNVEVKTNFPIKVHFLDHEPKEYTAEGLELIDSLIKKGVRDETMFFITSGAEAITLCKKIREAYKDIYCAEAYSGIDSETKDYIEDPEKYKTKGTYNQKLIMATNVAESSWTIKGLKCVIDSCYELKSKYDPDAMSEILEKKLITKAQALQRRGRVGRTSAGVCYHLLTKFQFDSLEEYPKPDILSQDITNDMLKSIIFTKEKTFDSGMKLMKELMDPPSTSQIDVSHNLFSLYKVIDDSNKLNPIGLVVAGFSSFPLNRIMFIIYAYQMYCAREACMIVSMIDVLKGNVENLFRKCDNFCDSALRNKSSIEFLNKMTDKKGDHFTYLNISNSFREAESKNDWAASHGIRRDVMMKIKTESEKNFRRLDSLLRESAPKMSRTKEPSVKTKLKDALKMSHMHLVSKNLYPTFPTKKNLGSISKYSVINKIYSRKELETKKFIYDEFKCINGAWEFNTITLIK